MSIGSPLLFVRVGSLVVCAIRSKALASIGDAILVGQSFTECYYVLKRLSPCAVPGIVP
jgi:hypothetical protein